MKHNEIEITFLSLSRYPIAKKKKRIQTTPGIGKAHTTFKCCMDVHINRKDDTKKYRLHKFN